MKGKGYSERILHILQYIVLYTAAVIILIPIANIIFCSFKTNEEINRVFSLPSTLNLANYIKVYKSPYAMISIFNSIFITICTISIAIFLSSLASYTLARRKEKGFEMIYFLFLSASMIPVAANLVPLYVLINKLGLTDSRTAIIIISAANSIPMGILLYTGFIKTLPKNLDEAAIMDGCNYFETFIKIIFPLLKPVTIAFAVLSSIGVWNDFLMPLLFIQSNTKKTLTLAVYSFRSEYESDWGAIYAIMTIAFLIPVGFFFYNQKYFYRGITIGSVKM